MTILPAESSQPPRAGTGIAPGLAKAKPAFDEADFKRRVSDEYKILQDKIDKIGSFRFTIKGWSVTALIAASAAGSATQRLSPVVTISVGLAIMLLFFFGFELEQVRLSRLFGDRARKLEDCYRRIDRGEGEKVAARVYVPFTAHEIANARFQQKILRELDLQNYWSLGKVWKRLVNWCRIVKQADIGFYFVLICMAFLLPLIPHHGTIGTYWRQWTGKPSQTAGQATGHVPIPIEVHK